MNLLQQDFHRLRCAGTPWCLILTPDYRECMRSLCRMLTEQDEPPSLWAWDCLQRHRCLSEASQTSFLGSPDDTVQAPVLLLKKALELPAFTTRPRSTNVRRLDSWRRLWRAPGDGEGPGQVLLGGG